MIGQEISFSYIGDEFLFFASKIAEDVVIIGEKIIFLSLAILRKTFNKENDREETRKNNWAKEKRNKVLKKFKKWAK